MYFRRIGKKGYFIEILEGYRFSFIFSWLFYKIILTLSRRRVIDTSLFQKTVDFEERELLFKAGLSYLNKVYYQFRENYVSMFIVEIEKKFYQYYSRRSRASIIIFFFIEKYLDFYYRLFNRTLVFIIFYVTAVCGLCINLLLVTFSFLSTKSYIHHIWLCFIHISYGIIRGIKSFEFPKSNRFRYFKVIENIRELDISNATFKQIKVGSLANTDDVPILSYYSYQSNSIVLKLIQYCYYYALGLKVRVLNYFFFFEKWWCIHHLNLLQAIGIGFYLSFYYIFFFYFIWIIYTYFTIFCGFCVWEIFDLTICAGIGVYSIIFIFTLACISPYFGKFIIFWSPINESILVPYRGYVIHNSYFTLSSLPGGVKLTKIDLIGSLVYSHSVRFLLSSYLSLIYVVFIYAHLMYPNSWVRRHYDFYEFLVDHNIAI